MFVHPHKKKMQFCSATSLMNFKMSSVGFVSVGHNEQLLQLKVHLTPKYFFAEINLGSCFKPIAPFCPFLTQILTFYRLSVRVMKSGHRRSHDQATKGYGSIPGLTSQTSLHACLQRLNVHRGQTSEHAREISF